MTAAERVRIRYPLFGILDRDRGLEIFGQTEEVQRMDEQIPPESVPRHRQTSKDLREIQSFPETHLFHPFHSSPVLYIFLDSSAYVTERVMCMNL